MTTRFNVRCLFIVAVLLFSIGLSEKRSLAWGAKGHQIIARIATERLSSKARQGIAELLGRESLESVANLFDMKAGRAGHSVLGHFVPIPLDQNGYDADRDCPVDCLIKAIESNTSSLGNFDESKAKRAEALRNIVHLIGDLHQPLHCADNNDAGGNKVRVFFFGQPSNLHKVWDDDIINRIVIQEKTQIDAYAEQLSNSTGGGKAQYGNPYVSGTIVDWALDSHRLARNAYRMNPDNKLDDDYFNENKRIVDEQLFKAGVRLAKVLNDIFE